MVSQPDNSERAAAAVETRPGSIRFRGTGMRSASGQIFRGERIPTLKHFGHASLGHHFAAARAGARPEIDQVIGGANRFFVVFDDDDGVAEIAQPAERSEQPRVVALVKSDAGLIQHVKNAGQARADLGGEANPLRFTARKRAAFAIEREIAESDFKQELQARLNFADHLGHDGLLLIGQVEPIHVARGLRRPFAR